jgi:SagB-type dehydrogenase family enzyme
MPAVRCRVTDTVYAEPVVVTDFGAPTSYAVSDVREHTDTVELAGEADPRRRPLLRFGTQVFLSGAGELHLVTLLPRLANEARGDGMAVTRSLREVVLSGDLRPAWRLLELMDGRARVRDILEAVEPGDRATTGALLATLERLDVVDASGRAVRRFLYAATQFLALPMPMASTQAVDALVADRGYRRYPEAARAALPAAREAPPRLRAFAELTRSRRSPERLSGRAWTASTLSGVLRAACGVTGETVTGAGRTPLRAHPSGGALYAVETYPIVLRVDGLAEGVYHYDPLAHELEAVRVEPVGEALLELCLQPELLRGAAVVFALTSHFKRAEAKYSSTVALRFLAVEAGHVSQNLILAATAAEQAARPFSAWLEPALNELLGLRSDDERYWFSVIAGTPSPPAR